jgi:hypothetical protein
MRLHWCWSRRPASTRTVPLRGYVEKVSQDQVTMLRGDAFRMKLDAVRGQGPMAQSHDQMIASFRCHHNILRQVFPINYERMIACGSK